MADSDETYDRAVELVDRYDESGNIRLLRSAVELFAVAVASDDFHVHLSGYGIGLRMLFERTGELELINRAIAVGYRAVDKVTDGHVNRPSYMFNLGTSLITKFETTGETTVLDEAVHCSRAALEGTPVDSANYPLMAKGLAGALFRSFEYTGDEAALTESIHWARTALARSGIERPGDLSILAIGLLALFDRTGDAVTLQEAVEMAAKATMRAPAQDPDRAMYLSTYAGALLSSFEHSGDLDKLRQSVAISREAITETPRDDPSLARYQSLHAGIMQRLFLRTGDRSALEEAITAGREAVAATPENHPERAARLHNLGVALSSTDEATEDRDIDEELRIVRASLAALLPDDPNRASVLAQLANTLWSKYEQTGARDSLTDAIEIARQAVTAAAGGTPDQFTSEYTLGALLLLMFLETRDTASPSEIRQKLGSALRSPICPIVVRINAGSRLMKLECVAGSPESALAVSEELIDLLPRVAPRTLSRSDRMYGLSRASGLASDVAAAAVAAGHPQRAVELLEQTRGILIADSLDIRSDLTELMRVAPELAKEFDELRTRLSTHAHDSTISSSRPAEPGTTRTAVADRWDSLLARIRTTPGFATFLEPTAFSDLRTQAADGPIVMIYASEWSSGALIVIGQAETSVKVVMLPDLKRTVLDEQVDRLELVLATDGGNRLKRMAAERKLLGILAWQWDTITSPILDALGIGEPTDQRPRVWWCPIGSLALLPIHASGHHTTSGGHTVMDRVTSSYITTIKSFQHARLSGARADASAVIIGMPTTPGASALPGVVSEVDQVRRLLKRKKVLIGRSATFKKARSALARHPIAHFACHGLADMFEPSASRLLLHDHATTPLTVAALARLHLERAELAYLSACSTTRTPAGIVDEAVHLTATVQLAGYRHVIGTLWPIHDLASAAMATMFYTHLTGDGAHPPRTDDTALALAEASRRLRDRYPTMPTLWAAHIHQGP